MSRREELIERLTTIGMSKRSRAEAVEAVIAEVVGPLTHDAAEDAGVVTERVHDGMVQQLRATADAIHAQAVEREFAASLLEAHDDTGINLAKWPEATAWLRRILGPDVDLPSNGV